MNIMKMNRKQVLPIALAAVALLIIGVVIWMVSTGKTLIPKPWTGVAGDPINVTLDFYEAWLEAKTVGPNEPFARGLLEYQQVGPELRDKLSAFDGQLEASSTDPVLCQSSVPEGLRTLPVFQLEESAQIMVRSTTEGHVGQAIIDLEARDGLWRITDINCGNAEQGPQGEFSFDKGGFLLKQVPAPLNPEYWHLVFQEAGVLGHAVPLFIDAETVCVNKDGDEVACDDNVLKETAPAHVKGQMGEAGVDVARIEMVDSVSIED